MDASTIIPIVVAVITSGGTLIGVLFSNKNSTVKMLTELEKQQILYKTELERQQLIYKTELEKQQLVNKAELEKTTAVINTQIVELTREVREHNGFAKRMPLVEQQIQNVTGRMERLEKSAGNT